MFIKKFVKRLEEYLRTLIFMLMENVSLFTWVATIL